MPFLRFYTFPNEYVWPRLTGASYYKRHHGLLRCQGPRVYVVTATSTFDHLHESFTMHYWPLVQMAQTYTEAEDGATPTPFPHRVYLQFVLTEEQGTPTVHVLACEWWLDPEIWLACMQQRGTFPFETYFTQTLHRMLSQCRGCLSLSTATGDWSSWSRYPLRNRGSVESMTATDPPPLPFWRPEQVLFPHQKQSWVWMYDLEQSILQHRAHVTFHPTSVPILNTGYYYHHDRALVAPVSTDEVKRLPLRGGVLADVTGSGKTAVTLALILSTLSLSRSLPQASLMTPLEQHLYFRSSATLVVTPHYLSGQWQQELKKFVQVQHLKIVTVTNLREFRRVTLPQLLAADLVLTTDTFVTSKRYVDEVNYQARCLLGLPPQSDEDPATVNPLAWRLAVNRSPPGLPQDGLVPLECIYWTRVVLDEIHTFFEPQSPPRTLPPLQGCFHWGLSGTPLWHQDTIMQKYVQFLCREQPSCWVPDFLSRWVDQCFHRFDKLTLTPLERHLYLIDQTPRETQLLLSHQDGHLSPERCIQLCSYFHLVEVQAAEPPTLSPATIEDIIKTVKREKRSRLKDLESKIRYHDLAIESIRSKMEESRQELATLPRGEEAPANDNVPTLSILDVTTHHDLRDALRSRKRRLERIVHRRDQLLAQKATVERSIRYFEAKVDSIKEPAAETCPICLHQSAHVITQCGHLFCRPCMLRCFKRQFKCPLCKTLLTPSDVHEIQREVQGVVPCAPPRPDDRVDVSAQRRNRYGSKFSRLLTLVESLLARQEKVVLFVQWNALLQALKTTLQQNHINVAVLSGNVTQQNAALKQFKGQQTHVLVGAINSTGLDLSCANHLVFVHALLGDEPVVRALEEQAVARLHRLGQTRTVNVYWFITHRTPEEQLYLQTRALT